MVGLDCLAAQADPDRIAAAHASFAAISPGLAAAHQPSVTQACMRPCPDDGKPMMGKIPGTENAYIGMSCVGALLLGCPAARPV
jgi:glycine/D-amino acid oxidase-like deaminating enzyme